MTFLPFCNSCGSFHCCGGRKRVAELENALRHVKPVTDKTLRAALDAEHKLRIAAEDRVAELEADA